MWQQRQPAPRHYRRRIKTLRELPQRAAGWQTRLTDRTYGREWEAANDEGRRQLMLNAGMTLKRLSKLHYVLTIPAAAMLVLSATSYELVQSFWVETNCG